MSAMDDAINQLTEFIANVAEMLGPVKEAAQGYREEMKRLGFNEDAANQMAVHYHEVLMAVVKNQAFGSKR